MLQALAVLASSYVRSTSEFMKLDTTHDDVILTADLDFINTSGYAPVHFGGSFDGRGHTIRNLQVTAPEKHIGTEGEHIYMGLFGRLCGRAWIRNLALYNVSVDYTDRTAQFSGSIYAGVLLASGGVNITNVTLNNCTVRVAGSHNIRQMGLLQGSIDTEDASAQRISIQYITVSNSTIYSVHSSNQNHTAANIGGLVGQISVTGVYASVVYVDAQIVTTTPLRASVGGVIGRAVRDAAISVAHVDVTAQAPFTNLSSIGGVVGNAFGQKLQLRDIKVLVTSQQEAHGTCGTNCSQVVSEYTFAKVNAAQDYVNTQPGRRHYSAHRHAYHAGYNGTLYTYRGYTNYGDSGLRDSGNWAEGAAGEPELRPRETYADDNVRDHDSVVTPEEGCAAAGQRCAANAACRAYSVGAIRGFACVCRSGHLVMGQQCRESGCITSLDTYEVCAGDVSLCKDNTCQFDNRRQLPAGAIAGFVVLALALVLLGALLPVLMLRRKRDRTLKNASESSASAPDTSKDASRGRPQSVLRRTPGRAGQSPPGDGEPSAIAKRSFSTDGVQEQQNLQLSTMFGDVCGGASAAGPVRVRRITLKQRGEGTAGRAERPAMPGIRGPENVEIVRNSLRQAAKNEQGRQHFHIKLRKRAPADGHLKPIRKRLQLREVPPADDFINEFFV